ncbi:hypothetical protein HDV06_000797, partial [Boothiomyces sp. JEL0866]
MQIPLLIASLYAQSLNDYLVVQGPATWPCLAYNHSKTPLTVRQAIHKTEKSPFLQFIDIDISHQITINFKTFLEKSIFKEQLTQVAEASLVSSITTIQDRHPQQYFEIQFKGLGNHTIDGATFAN